MQIDNYYIHWTDQCKYCTKGLNTTYCNKNQKYMENLQLVPTNGAIGSLEFKCDYFSFDKVIYDKLNPGDSI